MRHPAAWMDRGKKTGGHERGLKQRLTSKRKKDQAERQGRLASDKWQLALVRFQENSNFAF